MSEIELIKNQIKAMKELRDSNNPIVSEHISQIKKKYVINEDLSPRDISKYNVPKSTESEIEDNEGIPNDVSQGYRISGGILMIHGDDRKDVELTTDDKIAFQETMEEFTQEVSDMVDFNKLNVFQNNVEWSGKIIDFDIEFFYSIGEENGIYINGQMIRTDEKFLEMINKLKNFYEKFKAKWAKILSSRKKTKK